ncbi:MAG: porin [Gammaproteobacteria bacterium]|nr:porin [Gammaproteobacteria bacterium]
MKTKILLAAVAGALVMPVPMASQADVMSGMDFKISGRISAGITRYDADVAGQDAVWDLGSTVSENNRTDSRITLTADRETDFGTAGFKLERDWRMDSLGGGGDTRHQYVYLGGDWGTLYLGNHGTPVGMGNGYDQSYFYGGGGRINGTDRLDGIGYTYSSGALSFGLTLAGDDGDPAAAVTTDERKIADNTVNDTVVGVSYDFGVAKVGAAYWKNGDDLGRDSTSLMVSGGVGQLSYWVMYEAASDATNAAMKDDVDGLGVHLGYALSDVDSVWLQYGSKDYNLTSTADTTNTVIGYSHSFGGGATAVIEYHTDDVDSHVDMAGDTVQNPDPNTLHISVRVFF